MLAEDSPRVHGLESLLSSTIRKARKPKSRVRTEYFAGIVIMFELTDREHIPILAITNINIVVRDVREPIRVGEATDLIFNELPILFH